MGYWENRQAQIMYEQMEDAEKVARELADLYAKATRELNYQIGEIFDRFADKHNLTEEEARRLLGMMKNPADIATLREALAKDPKNAELLAELESPAYRARIERLENLQTEIDYMMQRIYGQEKTVTSAHYANVFHNSYYRNIYEIQRAAGFQFSFSAVDPHMLNQMLAMEWAGANYSSRIWNNKEALAKELKEQLIMGYLTGKSEADMAAEIANKFAVENYKARRIVRTESNFQSSQAQLISYEDAEIEKYMIVATLDLKTSAICREMDGKIFPRKEAKVGVNINPFHPFCRTTNVAVFDDDNLSSLKRRARDPVTGESKLVPADMNYKKWYEKNVANNPKAQAAEKMVQNWGADAKQYEAYKKLLGKKEAGKTFADFQEMKYNKPEKWKDVKGFANYMRKYPDSGRPFYNILRDLKEEGIKQGVSLPAKPKKAYILPDGKRDPAHIMKRMLERNITDDEIRGYVDNAKVMFSQWGGQRQMFITHDGVAVLIKSGDEWIFKTAWSKADFDEETLKILEVMSKYGK